MSEDDMAGTARGPNYNWKHEADHYRAECEKLRELLGKVEASWEREAATLESRLAWATSLLERAKHTIECRHIAGKDGGDYDCEYSLWLSDYAAGKEKGE